MSKRNGKSNIDDYFLNHDNIKLLNSNKFKSNSIINSKVAQNKNKTNTNNQINSIKLDFNNMSKYQKFISPRPIRNEQRTSIDNLKKITYYKYNDIQNKSISKNSTKNMRAKSSKRENNNKKKFYDYSNKLNDSIIKYKNKKNNSNLKQRQGNRKSPSHKLISYNQSFFSRTPKSSKSSKRTKSSQSTKKYRDDDYSLIIYKNKMKNKSKKYNIKKVSSNTDIKKDRKYFLRKFDSISKKKTIGFKNIVNKPLYKDNSYESQKNIRIIRNKNVEKKCEIKNKKEVDNYTNINKRNIYINLNVDNLSFNKKIFFSTENNTNSNTNYNSNNNSNNNTLKRKNINANKNNANKNENKENAYKTNHKETTIKEIKGKSFFSQNINKIERKKLSFDIFDNNKNDKNITNEIITKIKPGNNLNSKTNSNTKTNVNNINNINKINVNQSNSQNDQNSLIIKYENKKMKNNFQYPDTNNKREKKDNKNKNEDSGNSEDNVYQFITENEQGVNTGINSVKTNNFIINKPKEENLKYSSIKEFLDDNEEQTEISPSQISKIIIGQIEGYKDIMDEDKNKSKSILELLSKLSFSYMKNNRQSIENLDNLNFFEESNIKGEINDNDINNNLTNNSRNMTSDNNMPNLTNIKNVEEDYDSEDLSMSVLKNNIKSINTNSKSFLNKIFYNKQNVKNNTQNKNCVKISMNTNNTTISSGNNINKDINLNIKSNKDLINKDLKNQKNSKFSKNFGTKKNSPSLSTRYNLGNFKFSKNCNNSKVKKKDNKNNVIVNNRNDKNIIYLKNINKTKIIKKIETTKRQNTIKSNINIKKNVDTNIIFNNNKKNKKIKMIKNINELLNKSPIKDINNMESNLDEENNLTKKISNYNIPVLKIIGENETVVNNFINDFEKEQKDKSENICNKNESDNISEKNNMQCFIF